MQESTVVHLLSTLLIPQCQQSFLNPLPFSCHIILAKLRPYAMDCKDKLNCEFLFIHISLWQDSQVNNCKRLLPWPKMFCNRGKLTAVTVYDVNASDWKWRWQKLPWTALKALFWGKTRQIAFFIFSRLMRGRMKRISSDSSCHTSWRFRYSKLRALGWLALWYTSRLPIILSMIFLQVISSQTHFWQKIGRKRWTYSSTLNKVSSCNMVLSFAEVLTVSN